MLLVPGPANRNHPIEAASEIPANPLSQDPHPKPHQILQSRALKSDDQVKIRLRGDFCNRAFQVHLRISKGQIQAADRQAFLIAIEQSSEA